MSSKQEELRTLVGARYRDLMGSVDDTVAMFHTIEKLQRLLHDLSAVRACHGERNAGCVFTAIPCGIAGLCGHVSSGNT